MWCSKSRIDFWKLSPHQLASVEVYGLTGHIAAVFTSQENIGRSHFAGLAGTSQRGVLSKTRHIVKSSRNQGSPDRTGSHAIYSYFFLGKHRGKGASERQNCTFRAGIIEQVIAATKSRN